MTVLNSAWLNSSLQVSADEQLAFLKHLVKQDLPAKKQAIQNTQKDMLLSESSNSWKLFGKTGSNRNDKGFTEGWFVGFTTKQNQQYIFVTDFTSLEKETPPAAGGQIARSITETILRQKHLA